MNEGTGMALGGALAAVATIVAAVIATSCSSSKGEPPVEQRGRTNIVCGDHSHCGNH
ncbi:hypothetical protein [Streptomyces antimicrobicus]|uniref:Lipoprotein n=1 Tax=Streptomyces antimicrobicus TaxID=2883108 RepID=A0ABS8BB31_9ACTN|nr:hypothetical protein [Streptomyces antimicrobicus]MCB5181834.1 hypothetical protein [Streptomyces antimicrobicus]